MIGALANTMRRSGCLGMFLASTLFAQPGAIEFNPLTPREPGRTVESPPRPPIEIRAPEPAFSSSFERPARGEPRSIIAEGSSISTNESHAAPLSRGARARIFDSHPVEMPTLELGPPVQPSEIRQVKNEAPAPAENKALPTTNLPAAEAEPLPPAPVFRRRACRTCPDLGPFFSSCWQKSCDLGWLDRLCCPDPCYEGCWLPVMDASFYTPAVKPSHQMRLRWDHAFDLILPDRAEYFWPRADGNGRGPAPAPGQFITPAVRYHDLTYALELSVGQASVLLEVPYRSLDQEDGRHGAGMGDLKAGFKSLLFDRELMQIAFQFMTTVPTGNGAKGLGTEHASIDPSLLAGVRISPDTYLHTQLAQWIPLGGDEVYAGAILHTHTSLNHVLCRPRQNLTFVATCEVSTWSFQDGAYTDPVQGPAQPASGTTYLAVGPGLRMFVCQSVDFGIAASFGVTTPRWYEQLYTAEFRWRF